MSGVDPRPLLQPDLTSLNLPEPEAARSLALAMAGMPCESDDFEIAIRMMNPSMRQETDRYATRMRENVRTGVVMPWEEPESEDEPQQEEEEPQIRAQSRGRSASRGRSPPPMPRQTSVPPQVAEAPSALPDHPPGDLYEVVHRRVAIRLQPDLKGNIIGQRHLGDRLELLEADESGVFRKVCVKEARDFGRDFGWVIVAKEGREPFLKPIVPTTNENFEDEDEDPEEEEHQETEPRSEFVDEWSSLVSSGGR